MQVIKWSLLIVIAGPASWKPACKVKHGRQAELLCRQWDLEGDGRLRRNIRTQAALPRESVARRMKW